MLECVRRDLSKPILGGIWLSSKATGKFFQKIIYEGMGSLCTSYGLAGHGDTHCKDSSIEIGKNEAPPINPKAGLDNWATIHSKKPKKQWPATTTTMIPNDSSNIQPIVQSMDAPADENTNVQPDPANLSGSSQCEEQTSDEDEDESNQGDMEKQHTDITIPNKEIPNTTITSVADLEDGELDHSS